MNHIVRFFFFFNKGTYFRNLPEGGGRGGGGVSDTCTCTAITCTMYSVYFKYHRECFVINCFIDFPKVF